jgi:membrane-associated phospholipid phosphatase
MNGCPLKRSHFLTAVCLIVTLVIGVLVAVAGANETECNIVSNLQNLARKTIGLQVFRIVTYLGDFYMWVIFTSIYSIYAYIKSRKHLDTAIELAIFLIITTALTYSTKMVFARPRPSCSGISAYDDDVISSFSYPSGHVSRAAGAFAILSRGSRTKESLAIMAISLVSLSRIILGAHYLTDVVGGIFLSLAAQRLASLSLPLLKRKIEKRWLSGRHRHLNPGSDPIPHTFSTLFAHAIAKLNKPRSIIHWHEST